MTGLRPLACPYCGGVITPRYRTGWGREITRPERSVDGYECVECGADWHHDGTPDKPPASAR